MNIEYFTMSDSEYELKAEKLIRDNTPTLNDFETKITTIIGISRGYININNTNIFSNKEINLINELIEKNKLFIFYDSLTSLRDAEKQKQADQQTPTTTTPTTTTTTTTKTTPTTTTTTTRYVDTPIIEDKSMNTVTIDSPDPNLHKHEIIHSHDPELHTAQKRIRHFQT